jgi:hypothetical protein
MCCSHPHARTHTHTFTHAHIHTCTHTHTHTHTHHTHMVARSVSEVWLTKRTRGPAGEHTALKFLRCRRPSAERIEVHVALSSAPDAGAVLANLCLNLSAVHTFTSTDESAAFQSALLAEKLGDGWTHLDASAPAPQPPSSSTAPPAAIALLPSSKEAILAEREGAAVDARYDAALAALDSANQLHPPHRALDSLHVARCTMFAGDEDLDALPPAEAALLRTRIVETSFQYLLDVGADGLPGWEDVEVPGDAPLDQLFWNDEEQFEEVRFELHTPPSTCTGDGESAGAGGSEACVVPITMVVFEDGGNYFGQLFFAEQALPFCGMTDNDVHRDGHLSEADPRRRLADALNFVYAACEVLRECEVPTEERQQSVGEYRTLVERTLTGEERVEVCGVVVSKVRYADGCIGGGLFPGCLRGAPSGAHTKPAD